MKKLVSILFCFLLAMPLLAQETTDKHSFSASVVNKTGHVIRFTLGDSGFWMGITSGSAVNLFWDTYASQKISIEGLPTLGVYQAICHDISNINSGQTIIVNITDKANEASDFYCSIEPAVH